MPHAKTASQLISEAPLTKTAGAWADVWHSIQRSGGGGNANYVNPDKSGKDFNISITPLDGGDMIWDR